MRLVRFVIFSVGSAAIAGELADGELGCTITATFCRNFPEFTRIQFRDSIGEENLEAGSNEAACLKRAEDLHHWCGNNASMGAQVAATYNPKRWSQLYHQGACDPGWSQWDAFCYKYYWEMKTWPEAESLCRDRNSHLVSIHSQAENRFVAVLQHGLKGWIGYTDINKDTHYEWSDSTQDDFTNFAKNCTGREHEPDCKPEEVQQQWYTSKGVSKSPYTCKRNALLPVALLKNTSAKQLIEIPWLTLLPDLAGTAQGEASSIPGDTPILKVQDILSPKSETAGKLSVDAGTPLALQPHLGLPKGSFL